jgi:sigma-B regulation protein RsbU (phosphoserine phosphatase)
MTRALIIDDDPETEAQFKSLFGSNQTTADINHCVFATTDEQALDIIQSGATFDIAFIAIDRESVSGMSLFHQIKDRAFRVPRVAITAGRNLSDIRTAMNQGAVDFLVKPITPDDFTVTLTRVLETVERRRKNWKNQAEYSALKKEVDIAADMQQKILPRQFPDVPRYEFAARMRPAKSMGGDFYDIFSIPDGRTGIVVADVSGKGVPAAFYMAVARTLIHSVGMTNGLSPSDCLHQVNNLLYAHQIPGMFVSVFYAVISPDDQSGASVVSYANGGHQIPFKCGAGKKPEELLGGHGAILGIVPDMDYEEDSVVLNSGDYLYVYTDGATEAFNESRQPFGEDGLEAALIQIICENGGQIRAENVIDHVDHEIESFVGKARQHDDITSLVVHRS